MANIAQLNDINPKIEFTKSNFEKFVANMNQVFPNFNTKSFTFVIVWIEFGIALLLFILSVIFNIPYKAILWYVGANIPGYVSSNY